MDNYESNVSEAKRIRRTVLVRRVVCGGVGLLVAIIIGLLVRRCLNSKRNSERGRVLAPAAAASMRQPPHGAAFPTAGPHLAQYPPFVPAANANPPTYDHAVKSHSTKY